MINTLESFLFVGAQWSLIVKIFLVHRDLISWVTGLLHYKARQLLVIYDLVNHSWWHKFVIKVQTLTTPRTKMIPQYWWLFYWQGMAYLASMRVIHCDLAGRNVLLTDKLVAKITDFGLAKILQQDKDYYTRSTNKELPLMW